MTCKLFKAIVDNACVKLTIQCVDLPKQPGTGTFGTTTRILVSPWEDFTMADAQKRDGRSRCHVASLKRWNEVFKSFQLVSIRHMSSFSDVSLGRFWHNPYLQLDDFPPLGPTLLQHLRPVFERTKRPPTKVERERFALETRLPYSRGEIVNIITRRNKAIMSYSVRTWKARNIPLSSLSISARVKEWWIMKVRRNQWRINSYIVGYYGKRSLIIDVADWKIYQTAVPKKPPWR